MKTLQFAILILWICSSITSEAQISGKEKRLQQKNAKATAIEQLLQSKHFRFEARSLTTADGFFKDLNGDYDLVLTRDSVHVYLPYWGVVYMSTSYDEDGIKFDAMIENLRYKNREKKGHLLQFDVHYKTDIYYFTFNISNSGYADLTVNSTRRSIISYYGIVHDIEEY